MSSSRQLETFRYAVNQRSGRRSSAQGSAGNVTLLLWLPLTPLFLLLSPFALLAAPLLQLTPAARRLNPWRAVWALGTVLLSLSGTLISVENGRFSLLMRIL